MDIVRPDCSTELSGTSKRIIHEELLCRLTGSGAECFHQTSFAEVRLGSKANID